MNDSVKVPVYARGAAMQSLEWRGDFCRPAYWDINRWRPLRRSWFYVPVEGRV